MTDHLENSRMYKPSLRERIAARLWLFVMTGSVRCKLILLPITRQLEPRNMENCRAVASRRDLISRIELPPAPHVAEVGVFKGEFSRYLLDTLRPKQLYLFDLDLTKFAIAQKFRNEIDQGRVFLCEGDSSARLEMLPDNYFDLIYIDGDHTYEGVRKDIESAHKKLKRNGYLVFNDYTYWSPCECVRYGVMQAVNEFCLREDWEATLLALDAHMYCDIAIRRRSQKPM